MKSILNWGLQILTVIALGYATFLWFNISSDETTAHVDRPAIAEATLNLPVVTLLPIDVTPTYSSLAKVEEWQSSTLASLATGRVVWVCECFEEGQLVEAGTKLLQIDTAPYLRDLVEREKDLSNARAALTIAEAETERARADFARLDIGEPSDLVLKLPAQNAARLTLQSAIAALEIAQDALEETNIIAPYTGIISNVGTRNGDLVGANAALGTIIGTKYFRVRFPILEDQLGLVRIGAEIEVRSTVEPIITKVGIIEAIDIELDESTRLSSVIVSLQAPFEGQSLRLGRFVNGVFVGEKVENVFAIPLIAIDNEGRFYTFDNDNRLLPVLVQPLYRDFHAVYVAAGALEELRIVTGNVLGLRAGLLVQGYAP